MDHEITDTERLDWLEQILRQRGMMLKREVDGKLALMFKQHGKRAGVFSAQDSIRETTDVWLNREKR